MDTTAEVLKTVLGKDNVTETPANGAHGALVTANLSNGSLPEAEAFLWLMKDGDDLMYIGCKNGQVTSVDNVSFAPGSSINWIPTITALEDGFVFMTNDGASS
jgi:hypothetical protein